MESLNNTMEAVAVRHILEDQNLIGELMTAARYVIATMAVLINSAIAAAFLAQKCRRPNAVHVSPAGLLVLNLLLADALVGAVTLVNLATFSATMVAYPYSCSVRVGISYLALIGSHVALINVAFDRLVAISYNLHYREWMTLGRSVVMLCCGWAIPVTGAVVVIAVNDWRPGLLRCSDIDTVKFFLCYVWVPSQVTAILCVIVIQCRVYLCLRQHEKETAVNNHIFRRFSQKSAKILFRLTTMFVLCWGPFDVILIVIVWRISPLIRSIYDVTLMLAQLSFLANPLVYSYQTANIRRPIGDLYADIKRWGRPVRDSTVRSRSTSAPGPGPGPKPPLGVAVTGTGDPFRKLSASTIFFISNSSIVEADLKPD